VSAVASCLGFSQGEREVVRVVGGIAKAFGLDDGPTHTKAAIANPSAGSGGALRLKLPPVLTHPLRLALASVVCSSIVLRRKRAMD
jgi:hypothetical protein